MRVSGGICKIRLKILEPGIFPADRILSERGRMHFTHGNYFHYAKRTELRKSRGFGIDAFEGRRRNFTISPAITWTTPPEVRLIQDSSCYELINGNHRIASAHVHGGEKLRARVFLSPVRTPAQEMLLDVFNGNQPDQLYQPVDLARSIGWPTVRMCSDRFDLMKRFAGRAASGVS